MLGFNRVWVGDVEGADATCVCMTQKRRRTGPSNARSAGGPGHLKNEHRMTGNHLAGSQSDAAHAVLAAVGYNFELLLKWQSLLCALILTVLANATSLASSRQGTWATFFTDDFSVRTARCVRRRGERADNLGCRSH